MVGFINVGRQVFLVSRKYFRRTESSFSSGMVEAGGTRGTGGGRRLPLHILVDQLTLSQPDGQIMPSQIFRPSAVPSLLACSQFISIHVMSMTKAFHQLGYLREAPVQQTFTQVAYPPYILFIHWLNHQVELRSFKLINIRIEL